MTGAMAKSLMKLAHAMRRRAMALLGWRTRGVKVMAFDRTGRVLLVRHSYGAGHLHMFPGGGIARGEAPAAAAVRELREETACALRDATFVGRYVAGAEGRRDTVFLYRGVTEDAPVPDGREVIEAAFFATDALPATASPATRRRIEEMLGMRAVSPRW